MWFGGSVRLVARRARCFSFDDCKFFSSAYSSPLLVIARTHRSLPPYLPIHLSWPAVPRLCPPLRRKEPRCWICWSARGKTATCTLLVAQLSRSRPPLVPAATCTIPALAKWKKHGCHPSASAGVLGWEALSLLAFLPVAAFLTINRLTLSPYGCTCCA